jgi:hypothetical protein
MGVTMDFITIKTTNSRCHLYWCFNRVYRLEIQSFRVYRLKMLSVTLVFSTGFVNYMISPLTFSLVSSSANRKSANSSDHSAIANPQIS